MQERQKYLSPVFDRPIHTANLKPISAIVDLQLLCTTPALEKVSRRFPTGVLAVIHANRRLAKSVCVIESILSFQHTHYVLHNLRSRTRWIRYLY